MTELRERLEREVLPLVSRPSRYTGGERNVLVKDPKDVGASFLLAFPDVYEIGISHLGLRVLYDILNRRPDVAAERTYAPWTDMEKLMREKGIPLFSIESHRPAREFDVIGFTLQYELHYSNVLTMLDLAGVPARSSDRRDGDPLIVVGGPCAFNPEPIAEFLDCCVIGDGESVILDLADLVLEAKRTGLARAEILKRAAAIPGVYVPSLYRATVEGGRFVGTFPIAAAAPATVCRRVEPSLVPLGHPTEPLIPVTEATHDRLAVEIARGCTRGCRFCQAGAVTRPVRVRPVEDVLDIVLRGIATSGFDEVSLVSLSPSDYPELPRLLSELNRALFDRKVNVSLPSLRVDRFSIELADGIGHVRRAGLTFAPEAGTQRLRNVINKNETEEHVLETVDVAFASGWRRIKLYFMIGLPTETEDDLRGIADVVRKVRDVARARTKGAALSVSISPFVPKPGTPFQWERQDSMGEMRRKEGFLKSLLGSRGVKLALRDPRVSFLEGVMARGDRRLSAVVERACRAGARFDGWTESFDFEIWKKAFADEGIDPSAYLEAIPGGAPLFWDHLSAGPSKEFLLAERERALRGETTPDCREAGCFDCGACSDEGRAPRELPARVKPAAAAGASARPVYGRREKRRPANGDAPLRWRIRYAKDDSLRFVSHLDIVRAFSRAFAASGLPIVYSQGFNPHPRLSFGPPLPAGVTGEAEFVDVEFGSEAADAEVAARVSAFLPGGLRILAASQLRSKQPVAAEAAASEYVIRDFPGFAGVPGDEMERRIAGLRRTEEAAVPKRGELKRLRPAEQVLGLELIERDPPTLKVLLGIGGEGALRPVDVVRLLSGPGAPPAELARVHRTRLYRRNAPGAAGLEAIR